MRRLISWMMILMLLIGCSGCSFDADDVQKEDSQPDQNAALEIDDDVMDYFSTFADNYQVIESNDEGMTVSIEAPDFGALLPLVHDNAEETLSAKDWEQVADENPDSVKVYTVHVASTDEAAIRAAFLDAVMTDLYIASVAQMDLELLEPGERREDE